jgi:hypothetical protein
LWEKDVIVLGRLEEKHYITGWHVQ